MTRPRHDAHVDFGLTGEQGDDGTGATGSRSPAPDEVRSPRIARRPLDDEAGRHGAARDGETRTVRYRDALRAVLTSESKAYGFTLVVWGTGALTIAEHGLPGRSGTVAFLGGLLGGVVLATAVAFGHPRATWRRPRAGAQHYAAGLIHVLSVSSAVAAGWLCAVLVPSAWLAYLAAGAASSTVYQLVIAVEVTATTTGDEGGSTRSVPE